MLWFFSRTVRARAELPLWRCSRFHAAGCPKPYPLGQPDQRIPEAGLIAALFLKNFLVLHSEPPSRAHAVFQIFRQLVQRDNEV